MFSFLIFPLFPHSAPELRRNRLGEKPVLSVDSLAGLGQQVYAAVPGDAVPQAGTYATHPALSQEESFYGLFVWRSVMKAPGPN